MIREGCNADKTQKANASTKWGRDCELEIVGSSGTVLMLTLYPHVVFGEEQRGCSFQSKAGQLKYKDFCEYRVR
jgi:hypothetical protein